VQQRKAKGDLFRPCVNLTYTRTCRLESLIRAIQMVLCLCFLLQGSQEIVLVVVLETMQHPEKIVLVIVLETMQYPEKLAAHNLLQKCSLLCGRKWSGLLKLCFNNLGMLFNMTSAMKHLCELEKITYEKIKYFCTHIYIHILHRTTNIISSLKSQQKPEIFFIKIIASYTFYSLKYKFGSSYYFENVFKTIFITQKINSLAQEIYFHTQINVNIDLSMTLIYSSDNIYSMTYYDMTYLLYENACITTYHDMVSTNRDEMKMSIMIERNFYYYAFIVHMFWNNKNILKIYYILEWLPLYYYFIIFNYECKKYNG